MPQQKSQTFKCCRNYFVNIHSALFLATTRRGNRLFIQSKLHIGLSQEIKSYLWPIYNHTFFVTSSFIYHIRQRRREFRCTFNEEETKRNTLWRHCCVAWIYCMSMSMHVSSCRKRVIRMLMHANSEKSKCKISIIKHKKKSIYCRTTNAWDFMIVLRRIWDFPE